VSEAPKTPGLLDEELVEWLGRFREAHSRSPRVLHIGNIANNAYNNAKIMNAAGLDCDVLCFNSYHVMGTPEWDDADLRATPEDQFNPDWRQVVRFARPRWFAQGDLHTCLSYLLARRKGNALEASLLWYRLSVEAKFHPGDRFVDRVGGWHARLAERLAGSLAGGLARLRSAVRRLVLEPGGITPARARVLLSPTQLAWAIRGRLTKGRRARHRVPDPAPASPMVELAAGGHPGADAARTAPQALSANLTGAGTGIRVDATGLSCAEISDRWRREFPDRKDVLAAEETAPYRSPSHLWDALFDHYDIIQGYSTDPIRPFLAGRRYFAFEHGTLRHIPLQPDVQGRITCLGYRFAEHVFVTNFDCHQNAEWLAPGRFSLINHPMDEDQAIGIRGHDRLRAELCRALEADVLFFFPTRHDWVPGTGYADKANDSFLEAFVKLRAQGLRVGLVLCEWGANVEQSKSLLSRSGFDSHAHWTAPMAIVQFMRTARASDFVVDQFKLGAMGGIAVRAMMAGVPVISHLDEQEVRRHYPELPPIVNCRTTEEIIDRVRPLLDQPEERRRLGDESRAWIDRHHAKRTALNIQVHRYRDFLDSRGG
jgi:glycosyltransferase involved in cell wall biosynthesis